MRIGKEENMGEHDQTALHDEDAHGNIHDDGRTLRLRDFTIPKSPRRTMAIKLSIFATR